MSNFQKSKYFMKKGSKTYMSEHLGLVHQKNNAKYRMIKFNIFGEKNLGVFSVSYI